MPDNLVFGSGVKEKTFTFKAEHDDVDESDETVTLGFTNLPTGYAAGTQATAAVTIVDDDTAGVTVDPEDLDVNEGGSNTYDVVLDSKPAGNVTVTITKTGASSADVSFAPTTPLTFTTGNWDTPQEVTVRAAEDAAPWTTRQPWSTRCPATGPSPAPRTWT